MNLNYIDIIAVLLILFGAIVTAKAGFFKTLLDLAAYIGAAITAKAASTPLGQYVYDIFFKKRILDEIGELLPNGSVGGEITAVIDSVKEALPDALVAIADNCSLFPDMAGTNEILTVVQLEQQYVMPVCVKVLAVIAAIAVFLIALVLLKIVVVCLNKFFFGKRKHGIFKKLNSVLGFLLGVVKTSIPVAIGLAVIIFIAPVSGNEYFSDVVAGSYFCGLLTQLI